MCSKGVSVFHPEVCGVFVFQPYHTDLQPERLEEYTKGMSVFQLEHTASSLDIIRAAMLLD